jgi:hypothetical protein
LASEDTNGYRKTEAQIRPAFLAAKTEPGHFNSLTTDYARPAQHLAGSKRQRAAESIEALKTTDTQGVTYAAEVRRRASRTGHNCTFVHF